MKYVFAVLLIVVGVAQFLSDLPNLPAGIMLYKQGNFAASGAATGGLVFGPVLIFFGAKLWASARRSSAEKSDPGVSAEQRVKDSQNQSSAAKSDSETS